MGSFSMSEEKQDRGEDIVGSSGRGKDKIGLAW